MKKEPRDSCVNKQTDQSGNSGGWEAENRWGPPLVIIHPTVTCINLSSLSQKKEVHGLFFLSFSLYLLHPSSAALSLLPFLIFLVLHLDLFLTSFFFPPGARGVLSNRLLKLQPRIPFCSCVAFSCLNTSHHHQQQQSQAGS